MSHALPKQIRINADGSVRLMSRIVGLDDVKLVQADVSTIAWQTWLRDAPTVEDQSGTLVVSSAVFDALQTESWDTSLDASGYNVRWDVPATVFPTPLANYGLAIKFTLSDDHVVWDLWSPDTVRTAAE